MQYYDMSAMQAEIDDSRNCGRPIDVQWIIRAAQETHEGNE